MDFTKLSIDGAWEVSTRQFGDERGTFLEWFKGSEFAAATGNGLDVAQANCSVSAAGVIRGIHFADVPPGQAKYVTCVSGAVWDVVVDLRVGSPSFGSWDAVQLDDVDRRGIYLSEGLGHGFMSLAPNSAVVYLCSTDYAPAREHEVHPLDDDLGIAWPTVAHDGSALNVSLSPKDAAAPSLEEARAGGLLPMFADCEAHRRLQ